MNVNTDAGPATHALNLICVERVSADVPCSQVWADTAGSRNYCTTYLAEQTGPDAGSCVSLGTISTDMDPNSRRFRYFAACIQATMAGNDCTYSEDTSVADMVMLGLTLAGGAIDLLDAVAGAGAGVEAPSLGAAGRFGEYLRSAEPATLTMAQAREFDLAAMRLLSERSAELIAQGALPYLRARVLFAGRNALRMVARQAMIDRDVATMLDESDPNLTWDQAVDKYGARGLSGDDLWNAIADAALRSRAAVNVAFGLSP